MTLRDTSGHLTVAWKWLPVPPLPLEARLPRTRFRDDAAFLAILVGETCRPAFQFSFPQLSASTPDLRFYRLVQLFNTPLYSMTSRDAGRSSFAYWGGAPPSFAGEQRFAHFWFFEDQTDQDILALEFTFDGGFVIHSEKKAEAELVRRYAEICRRLKGGGG